MLCAFVFTSAAPGHACSCNYQGDMETYSQGKTVIKATIIAYGPRLKHGETLHEDMMVEIIQVIKGEYTAKRLKLLGDPGWMCRGYIDSERFPLGSTHLFMTYGNETEQALIGCGESTVRVKGGKITTTKMIDYEPFSTTYDYETYIDLLTTDTDKP